MAFTREYFRSQCVLLRELFGTRKFWQDPGCVAKASKALAFTYLNIEGEPDDRDVALLDSTLTELTRREILVAMMPPELLCRKD